nr:DUF6415 family natural product biosynthesis protein [Streptomyces typhae]
MRSAVCHLMAPGGAQSVPSEVDTLAAQLRDYLVVLIPAVEARTDDLPLKGAPRACALACVGEARMRLGVETCPGLSAAIVHAQRLARCVEALCDHYEDRDGEHS